MKRQHYYQVHKNKKPRKKISEKLSRVVKKIDLRTDFIDSLKYLMRMFEPKTEVMPKYRNGGVIHMIGCDFGVERKAIQISRSMSGDRIYINESVNSINEITREIPNWLMKDQQEFSDMLKRKGVIYEGTMRCGKAATVERMIAAIKEQKIKISNNPSLLEELKQDQFKK